MKSHLLYDGRRELWGIGLETRRGPEAHHLVFFSGDSRSGGAMGVSVTMQVNS